MHSWVREGAGAALGLKGFLLPSRFIDGGVTGVSMLVALVLNVCIFPVAVAFHHFLR